MASFAAYTALRGFLEAHWSSTLLCFENGATEPPQDAQAAWVYVEIESDEDSQSSIGAGAENSWRETGDMTLYVLIPAGAGTGDGRALRDQLADLFRAAQIGQIVCTRMRRTGGISWEGEGTGNYWGLPLVVEWHMDS